MHDITAWTLGGLACWRLTHLLWAEDGPGRMLARGRALLPVDPASGQTRWVGCFYCLSLWVALPVSAAALWATSAGLDADEPATWARFVLGWLGLSAGAISLERALDRSTAPPELDLPRSPNPSEEIAP